MAPVIKNIIAWALLMGMGMLLIIASNEEEFAFEYPISIQGSCADLDIMMGYNCKD